MEYGDQLAMSFPHKLLLCITSWAMILFGYHFGVGPALFLVGLAILFDALSRWTNN
jgi:hypothetical protein